MKIVPSMVQHGHDEGRAGWYTGCAPLLLEFFFPRFPRHGLCHTVDGSTQMQVLGKQLAKSCRKSALE